MRKMDRKNKSTEKDSVPASAKKMKMENNSSEKGSREDTAVKTYSQRPKDMEDGAGTSSGTLSKTIEPSNERVRTVMVASENRDDGGKIATTLDDRELNDVAQMIGLEWWELGISLGFSNSQLEQLRQVYPNQPVAMTRVMLGRWLSIVSQESVNGRNLLAFNLDKVGRRDAAEKISENFQTVVYPNNFDDKIQSINFDVSSEDKDYLRCVIESWKNEDKSFYETEAYRKALKLFKRVGSLTLIGAPGEGKTMCSRHIALKLEEEGYKIIQVHNATDILKYHQSNVKQLFVADDPIGVHVVDFMELSKWTKHSNTIKSCIVEGQTKVIATIRKSIFKLCGEELGRTIFRSRDQVLLKTVDLSDKAFCLTREDKEGILKIQLKAGKYESIEQKYIDHLLTDSYFPGFPLLCHLIGVDSERLDKIDLMQSLSSMILQQIKTLAEKDKHRYCALVLTALNDGKFKPSILNDLQIDGETYEDYKKIKCIFEMCGLSLVPENIVRVMESFKALYRVYLTEVSGCYQFSHVYIFSAVIHHYGEDHLPVLFKFGSSFLIREMVRTQNAPNISLWGPEDECKVILTLRKSEYGRLVSHMVKQLENKHVLDVFLNPSLLDTQFHMQLADHLKSHYSLEQLKELLYTTPLQKDLPDPGEQEKITLDFAVLSSTPIHWMCKLGLRDMLCSILKTFSEPGSIINSVPGHTQPLHFAAGFGHLDLVRYLLELGVDVNSKSSLKKVDDSVGEYYSGFTPLFYAARQNHVKVVKYLLKKGADPNMVRDHGASPMLLTADRGHAEVISALINHQADPNICCEHGTSPLYLAAQEGHLKAVEVLIAGGANLNIQKPNGTTPLFIAAKKGHAEVVEKLLKHGSNPNLQNKDGQTPIWIAVFNKHAQVIKTLLQANVDVNIQGRISPHALATCLGIGDLFESK